MIQHTEEIFATFSLPLVMSIIYSYFTSQLYYYLEICGSGLNAALLLFLKQPEKERHVTEP